MKKPKILTTWFYDVRPFVALGITGVVVLGFARAPLGDFENDMRPPKPRAVVAAQIRKQLAEYMDYAPLGIRPRIPIVIREAMARQQAIEAQVTDLLWSGDVDMTSHGGDTLVNVRLAASAVDMTYLRPNEIFSFNDVVGVRTEEKGYRSGLMYANGELVTGVGGGICMVSTMIYHAALYSGLKILDRHPHSGPVSYAKPGFDAAVAWGLLDLAFKNDTGSPLLVRAMVEGNRFVVAIYGTKHPGRKVEVTAENYQEIPYKILEVEDPTIPDGQLLVERKAHVGWNVTVVRTIWQSGFPIKRETMNTDSMPAQDKIIRVPWQALPGVNLQSITPLPPLPSLGGSPLSTPSGFGPAAPPKSALPAPFARPSVPIVPVASPRPVEPAPRPGKAEPAPVPPSVAPPALEPKAPGPEPPLKERSLSNSERTSGSLPK